jgi:Uncharacterized conserved protein (DUF2303)
MTDSPETTMSGDGHPPELNLAEHSLTALNNIGISAVHKTLEGTHQHSVAERTGELMRVAHDVANELHYAKLITFKEPETDVQTAGLLKPDGSLFIVQDDVFDSYRTEPKRRALSHSVASEASFINMIDRFKDPGCTTTVLLAYLDAPSPRVDAVFDYHEPTVVPALTPDTPDAFGRPGFGKQKISYPFPLSREWRTWQACNKVQVPLAAFATFIDDNYLDVEDMTATTELSGRLADRAAGLGAFASKTDLLTMAKGMTICEQSTAKEYRNPDTGEMEISFVVEHTDGKGGKVNIPRAFMLNLPVFNGGDLYRIIARLRTRKKADGIEIWYELQDSEAVLEEALKESVLLVADRTGVPAYFLS